MADLNGGPGPDTGPGPTPPEETAPDWGRLIDAAGIVAGILLVLIAADIWTDGRVISRRLHRGGGDTGDDTAE